MPCYRPLEAWRKASPDERGKFGVTFRLTEGSADKPLFLPCGQCIGCKLERSRQWAIRCLHEAQMHEESCYLTLTYDDEHLPADYSVSLEEMQLFTRRLKYHEGSQLRYFLCGEYGETTRRPHYHALIFGYWPKGTVEWKRNENGDKLFTSAELLRHWPYGHSSVGAVTFQSAAYVSRYVTKKITGPEAETHYRTINPLSRELVTQAPEFLTMSKRPGIGASWLEEFGDDVRKSGKVVVNGHEVDAPRYYTEWLKVKDQSRARDIRGARVREAEKRKGDNGSRRLKVKEKVKTAKAGLFKRDKTERD